ncbi:hypothetical protein KCU67_g6276, partial [Aureobasidium melanogenum]
MARSRPLLALPNELLAMIIESADLTVKDLANLRLACKHTKHFASRALGRRIFVDLDIRYERDAFYWYTDLLLSDLGSCMRSVSLITWPPRYGKSYPLKRHVRKKIETKPVYSQLQQLTVDRVDGPVRSWKKALCAASHLKTLRLTNPDDDRQDSSFWQAVYRHKFDKSDELLSSIKSDCLDTLVLARLHVSGGILKRLLDVHKETLSTLDIKVCILVDGNWLEMLEWIRINFSRLQTFCLDVRHEALEKKISLYQQPTGSASTTGLAYIDTSPYALERYDPPLRLRLEGQREIVNGLSVFLKARERDQAR